MNNRVNSIAASIALILAFSVTSADAGSATEMSVKSNLSAQQRAAALTAALRSNSTQTREYFAAMLNMRGGEMLMREVPFSILVPRGMDLSNGPNDYAEVSLVRPDGTNQQLNQPSAVYFAPEADEDDWVTIDGYSLVSGKPVSIRAADLQRTTQTYLFIKEHGGAELRALIDASNANLLGNSSAMPPPKTVAGDRLADSKPSSQDANGGAEKDLGLVKYYFSTIEAARADEKDGEWGNLDAEIFGLFFGIKEDGSEDGVPFVEVHDMPWFDRRYISYHPNQRIVNWYNETSPGVFDYKVKPFGAILWMEYDHPDSYAQLLQVAAEEIGNIAGFGEIGGAVSRVIGAMPEHWLKNDNDYLDVHYDIGDEPFSGRGASNNIWLEWVEDIKGFHMANVAGPDLDVQSLVNDAGTYWTHQELETSFCVRNVGAFPSKDWTAEFFLLPVGPGNPLKIAQGASIPLDPNQVSCELIELPLTNVPPGMYRVRIEIDSEGDLNSANDVRTAPHFPRITVMNGALGDLLGDLPDLEATYITTVSGSYGAADSIETWFGIENVGANASGADVHFRAVNEHSGEKVYLVKGYSSALAAGEQYQGVIDVPLAGLSPGTWRMEMQVGASTGEQIVSNNTTISPFATFEIELGLVGN